MNHIGTRPAPPRTIDGDSTGIEVALVGCGPKGLFCLERLVAELERVEGNCPIRLTVFEPATFPGAGNVYDPRLPHYLRMNFANRHINIWRDAKNGRSLVQWLAERRPHLAHPEHYAPRAIVGEYLHTCFLEVIERLSQRCLIRLVNEQVERLEHTDEGWQLVVTSGRCFQLFDEVLLTVGHEGWRASDGSARAQEEFDIPHVYPTTQQLSVSAVPAGCRVALRGFGLTSIDAIIALTEGREGRFRQFGDQWKYEPSGREPMVIYPYSRSGRPMLAKPVASRVAPPNAEYDWDECESELLRRAEGGAPLRFGSDLWPLICNAADRILNCSNRDGAADWFRRWQTASFSATRVRQQLQCSVAVATGKEKCDAAWALGESWRRLYPTLVKLISHDRLLNSSWPEFCQIAGEMERIAFGPSVESCVKLLALTDSGHVDLTFGCNPSVDFEAGSRKSLFCRYTGRRVAIDKHVNAVLPKSVHSKFRGPLDSLLRRGTLSIHSSGLGYRIDRAGRVIDSTDQPVAGLSLIGRPTEGCVLGNDTLNPHLHDHPSAWARRIGELVETFLGSAL